MENPGFAKNRSAQATLANNVMSQENTTAEVIEPDAMSELVLLDKVKGLFPGYGDHNLGSPEAPTKEGFLALAREGKEVWNTWRTAWPEPIPDFSGIDFRDTPIDFSGFSFAGGDWYTEENEGNPCVDFSRCQFGDSAFFSKVLFGEFARFDNTRFGKRAYFNNSQFDDYANFDGAQFSRASFINVQFGDYLSFDGAQFDREANFDGSSLGHSSSFSGAHFAGDARFSGAQFGNDSSFYGARFARSARFHGAQFGNAARFDGAQFGGIAFFNALEPERTKQIWSILGEQSDKLRAKRDENRGLQSGVFRSISFCGAQFSGDISFQGRTFLDSTDFGPTTLEYETNTINEKQIVIPKGHLTRFKGIPNFHGCTLHQDTSFDDAEFLAKPSAAVARAYRTLKLAFAQQHAIREEQRFFKLEMQAETGIATGPRRLLYKAYEDLSDYGFSLKRPFKFWLACLIFFAVYNGLLAASRVLLPSTNWARISDLAQYTLLNAAPLPGFEKKLDGLRIALFPTDALTQLTVTIMEISHKSLSLVAFFLVGLALRNLFKMKG